MSVCQPACLGNQPHTTFSSRLRPFGELWASYFPVNASQIKSCLECYCLLAHFKLIFIPDNVVLVILLYLCLINPTGVTHVLCGRQSKTKTRFHESGARARLTAQQVTYIIHTSYSPALHTSPRLGVFSWAEQTITVYEMSIIRLVSDG